MHFPRKVAFIMKDIAKVELLKRNFYTSYLQKTFFMVQREKFFT